MSRTNITPAIIVRELVRILDNHLVAGVPESRRRAMPATANPGAYVEHRLLRRWIRLGGRARASWPLVRRELDLSLERYVSLHLANAAKLLSTEILADPQAGNEALHLMTTWRHVAEPWSSRCQYRGLSLVVYRRKGNGVAEILWGWERQPEP